MRRMLHVAVAAAGACAAVGALVVAPAAMAAVPASPVSEVQLITPAGVEDFTFRSMDVQYTLGRAPDGTSTLRVVETFVAQFPDTDQNRGMRRVIPDTYDDQPLFPELESITDETGAARPADADSDDGEYSMTSAGDDFVRGEQTYVFTYTLRNVTRIFDDTGADEFYWDVNGVHWLQPFGRVSATVSMDGDLADALTGRSACYRGVSGATDTCQIDSDSADGFTVVAAEALDVAPEETMTIAVGFEQGTFARFDDGYFVSPWGWWQAIAGVGVAGAVAFAAVQRRRLLRDEPGRGVIIPEYDPPRRIDALQSAVLLGSTAKAVPAEVLEQAVAGSIRIVEGDRRAFGGVKLKAELVDPARADGDGRMLLAGLFGEGATVASEFEFGRADTRFSSAAQKILQWANRELVNNGLRRKVGWAPRVVPVVIAVAAMALVFVFGLVALGAGVAAWGPVILIVAAVLALILVIGLVAHKPLTSEGAATRDHLLGLKMFIEWAEADRIRMLQSPAGAERRRIDVDDPRQMLHLYEQLLPYAVVFGQEKEWAERIVVLYGASTPYWYVGGHGFDASALSSGIGSLSSASSSSSSGGSSGGGSAGGGGGGGGGGGV